jgi:hypothetical protein
MRCEIGWPIVTFVPGNVEKPRRSSACLSQPHVDFRRFHSLDVFIKLRAAGAPRGRDHLWLREKNLLHAPADFVRLGERGARQRVRLHRQAAFVEFRKE